MLNADGELVDGYLANLTLRRVWETLEQAIEHSNTKCESIDPSLSLYDEFTTVTQKQVEAGELSNYERELVLGMAQMWGAYVGDSVDRQSMKFFFLEDCIEGGKDDEIVLPRLKLTTDRRLLHSDELQEDHGKVICIARREGSNLVQYRHDFGRCRREGSRRRLRDNSG